MRLYSQVSLVTGTEVWGESNDPNDLILVSLEGFYSGFVGSLPTSSTSPTSCPYWSSPRTVYVGYCVPSSHLTSCRRTSFPRGSGRGRGPDTTLPFLESSWRESVELDPSFFFHFGVR